MCLDDRVEESKDCQLKSLQKKRDYLKTIILEFGQADVLGFRLNNDKTKVPVVNSLGIYHFTKRCRPHSSIETLQCSNKNIYTKHYKYSNESSTFILRTEGSRLMLLLGPGKSSISQKSHLCTH